MEGSVPKPRTQHWNGAIISFWQMIQLMIEKTHRQAIFFSLSSGGKRTYRDTLECPPMDASGDSSVYSG